MLVYIFRMHVLMKHAAEVQGSETNSAAGYLEPHVLNTSTFLPDFPSKDQPDWCWVQLNPCAYALTSLTLSVTCLLFCDTRSVFTSVSADV